MTDSVKIEVTGTRHWHIERDDMSKWRGFEHEHTGPHPAPKATFYLLSPTVAEMLWRWNTAEEELAQHE